MADPFKSCAVAGCNRPARKGRSLGYCGAHEARYRKHGDVQADKPLRGFRGDRSCIRCDTKNPRTPEFFTRLSTAPDGLKAHCRECNAKMQREWRAADPEKWRRYHNEWRNANIERARENERNWSASNPDKVAEKRRRARAAMPVQQRFSQSVSSRVRYALRARGGKKEGSWRRRFGYSPNELVAHIERQFTKGMTWENYGTFWHLDHIVPVKSFNFTSYDDPEFKAVWALTNLRPLEKSKNLQKQAKRTHLL